MTTIDLKHIIKEIDSLKQQLPPNSELTRRLNQETSSWVATVREVNAWLEIKRLVEEQESQGELRSPILTQIKAMMSDILPFQEMTPSVKTPIPPVITSELSVVKTEIPSNASEGNRNQSKSIYRPSNQLDVSDYRRQCWELAHSTSQKQIDDLIIHEFAHLERSTTTKPHRGDIVLRGTLCAAHDPIRIAPTKAIPEFSQLAVSLPFINLEGAIWLDFSESFTDSSNHLEIPIPSWCHNNEGTALLWLRWVDLLYWLVMSPEFLVFITGQKTRQLSADRESILTACLTIHRDFNKAFNAPEQFVEYLGYNLHRLYSTFHQLLCDEDMVFDSTPQHVIAHLRAQVDSNVNIWRERLYIHEEHATGPLNIAVRGSKGKEFLASTSGQTDQMNNINLPLQYPFCKKIRAEKNQVLYWTKPYWKQLKLSPTHHYFELKGAILYCYE